MKEIVVAVTNTSNSNVELFKFLNEEEAKKYIKERYINEIKKAPIYDYENTYIDKGFRKAKISAGMYNVNISMCKNIKCFQYKKHYKNSQHKKNTGRKKVV